MANTLVTGATGFIGAALCEALVRAGHTVRRLSRPDGDIADAAVLDREPPVNHVFHLAGRTFVPDSWRDPLGFQSVNVLGTVAVLEYCRRHQVRLTYVSGYLYGIPDRLPVSEAAAPRPNNPYALSKHLAEQVCEFYAASRDVEVTTVRPFNIFGPGQNTRFLIPQIVKDVVGCLPVRVKDLAPRRDYLYIQDLIDALIGTMTGPGGYQVYNIGSGSSLSVGEIIAIIQAAAGTDLPVVCEGDVRPNEIADVYADIGKAKRMLGWKPAFTFQKGVERMMVAELESRLAGNRPKSAVR